MIGIEEQVVRRKLEDMKCTCKVEGILGLRASLIYLYLTLTELTLPHLR